jgi:hypothetical protein
LVAVAPLGGVIPLFSTTVAASASGSISGSFSAPTALGHYVAVAVGGFLIVRVGDMQQAKAAPSLVGCGPVAVTFDVVAAPPTTTTTTLPPTPSTTPTPPTTTVPLAHPAPITPTALPVTG